MASPDDPNSESIAPEPEIILEVEDFPTILTAVGPPNVPHSMRMKRDHPKVSVGENGKTLLVKWPGAKLHFEVTPPDYFPVGISFKLISGIDKPSPEQRLGLHNFTYFKPEPQTHVLIIKDDFIDDQANDDYYKFSIIIQRGSDGELGVIDPGFRHQPI
jgi:hypothetical protein